MEVELKLSIAARDAEALRQHPLLKEYATATPHEQTMSDTYFDTPEQHMRLHDAGLRVRQVGDDWIQTMKGGGGVAGGLHSRNEWESLVSGPAPDLARLRDVVGPKSAWSRLLRSAAVEDHLEPIFTTSVRRQIWDLRLPQGDLVECALDQGSLDCGGAQQEISELELELKSGEPAHLFDFALALQQEIPLQIGTLSKAERGYAMYAATPPAPVKAAALVLSKRMTIEQAFQAIAANCMVQVTGNEAGVAGGQDVESLHQMRVGLRRLGAGLDLFKDLLTPPEDLAKELEWLGEQLGPARDWDVLAGTTLPPLGVEMPAGIDLAAVRHAAQLRGQENHRIAAEAVTAPRYTRLVLRFTRWVLSCGWRESMSLQDWNRLAAPLKPFAQEMLQQGQRRLLRRGRKLGDGDGDGDDDVRARHRVRIAAKKARYASEFFASLYAAKRLRRYGAALARMQDELGAMNDAAVADRLLGELQAAQPQLAGSAAYLRGYLAARLNLDDRKLLKSWKKFRAAATPV